MENDDAKAALVPIQLILFATDYTYDRNVLR